MATLERTAPNATEDTVTERDREYAEHQAEFEKKGYLRPDPDLDVKEQNL